MKRLLNATTVLLLTALFMGARDAGQSIPDPSSPPPSGTSGEGSEPASPEDPSAVPSGGGRATPPPEVQKEIERSRASEAKASALREAASAHPADLRYQVDWLQGLLELGRVEEALGAAPALVEKFPRSEDLMVVFGRLLLRDGQFDLAGVQFQRALSTSENARTRSLAARTALIKGDLKAAEEDLRKSLKLDPELQEARQMLALLYERTGRYSEALDATKGAAAGGRRALLEGFVKEPPMVLPQAFSPVTVPFIAQRGFPPAIKLQIGEGIETLFVIDTASEDVSLTEESARSLGLLGRKEGVKEAGAPTAPAPAAVSYALIPRVMVGSLVIKRVPVRITPGLRYPDAQIAGSLGRAFLRSFRIVLDYPSRTLTLLNAAAPPLEGVPFDLASVILLEGFNGDKALGKFVLDTSSYTSGAMDARLVAEETGFTIFSEEVKKIPSGPYLFKFTMPSLRVGGTVFSRFPATAVDLRMMSRQIGVNVRGVIGNSLLNRCRLEIDFKNQRLSLERASAPEPAPARPEPGA